MRTIAARFGLLGIRELDSRDLESLCLGCRGL